MRRTAIAVAMICVAATNAVRAAPAADPAAEVSLSVGCIGGVSGRLGRVIEVSGTGAMTLICPKPFASSVSPATAWRLSGTPVDAGLVSRMNVDLDAAGFDDIPPQRFPGPVPDGLSCTLTRTRGAVRHGVSIATDPARDVSHLSPNDRRGYEAVRATIDTLHRLTRPAVAGATPDQCPSARFDPGEIKHRSHVTAICRHRSRSVFIEAQVDEDGSTTLWDWSFRTDQPPSSAWSRPPIPVTFPASPMAGAADLIAALDRSGFVAADAPGDPDLICGLERASMQAGTWSVVRQEWPGLEPPRDASEEVWSTFDAIRMHTDALPDAGTFRLVEQLQAVEP